MQGNLNPSARVAIVAAIDPQQAQVGTLATAWVSMAKCHAMLAIVAAGVFGAGATVDARLEQATDATGSNAKPLPGLAITQLAAAGGNNRQSEINLREASFDKNNGFKFVRLSVTVGGAATFLSGQLLGLDPRYGTAAVNQAVSVAETIG